MPAPASSRTKHKLWRRAFTVGQAVVIALTIQSHLAADETDETRPRYGQAKGTLPEALGDFNSNDELTDETLKQLWYAQSLIDNAQRARLDNGLLYARELLNKAVLIVADARGIDSSEYGLCLGKLGSIDIELYRFNDAIDELQKARLIMRQHRDAYTFHNVTAVACNLASAHRKRGETDIAVRLYEEVIQDCRKEGPASDTEYAIVLLSLANLWLDVNDPDKAFINLQTAQRALDEKPRQNEPIIAGLNAAWGRYYYLKKDYAESNTRFKQALTTLGQSKNAPPAKYAEVVCDFSTSLADQTEYADAISILDGKANEIEKRLGRDHPLVLEIHQKTVTLKALRQEK